jgi:arylsulfatase
MRLVPPASVAYGTPAVEEKRIRRALLLTAGLGALTLLGCRREESGPNLLFFLVDALRPDHVGCYGYTRPTTPAIDKLAERGIVFTNNTSPSSYTRATVPSIFTSVYPFVHGVLTQTREAESLSEDFMTLAETLKARGYVTGAYMPNPSLKRVFNFDQGFDVYRDDLMPRPYDMQADSHETASKIHRQALEFLDSHPGRSFFLYLHYRDVHGPYVPPAPYDRMFWSGEAEGTPKETFRNPPEYLRLPWAPKSVDYYLAQYDGEIRYSDDRITEFLAELDRRGRLKNTVIVVSSDHGEAFLEHGGWGHGTTLYQEEIHAPLILVLPDSPLAGRRVDAPVQTLDLFPTFLELLGAEIPIEIQGKSLLAAARGSTDPLRPVFSEGRLLDGRYAMAVRVGSWKLIRDLKNDRTELYDLDADPGEKDEAAARHPEKVKELLAELGAFQARNSALRPRFIGGNPTLDRKTIEQLEALGYVQ